MEKIQSEFGCPNENNDLRGDQIRRLAAIISKMPDGNSFLQWLAKVTNLLK